MKFDRIAVLDWSAAAKPTPKRPSPNAIWIGQSDGTDTTASYHPTRASAETALHAMIEQAIAAHQTLLIGADFAFGYPAGFAPALTGRAEALAVWDWLAPRIHDLPDNANSHKTLAAEINGLFPGDGPFWGNGEARTYPGLAQTKPALPASLTAHRATEAAARSATSQPKSVWQLAGAGAVGAQTLLGLPMLARLRAAFPDHLRVWPFEPCANAPIVLAEIYPALIAPEVNALTQAAPALIRDEAQVRLLAAALATLSHEGTLTPLFHPNAPQPLLTEEGWILGAGFAPELRRAALAASPGALPPPTATLIPPRLRNDCFAMPQGVSWVPVDEALRRLRDALTPLTLTETLPTAKALGRILTADSIARRANPPRANSAVDGYGFAQAATSDGPVHLPLVRGRAAAGQPFDSAVPFGSAIRILTGAILPEGVDTVVLEEDTATDGARVAFDGPVKLRANTRRAGEDITEGALALPAGHRLRAPDLALLSAIGIAQITAYRPLRVGVLSTGDEILPDPSQPAAPHQIYDANRPMLLALAAGWGYQPVDLGHVRDSPALIARRLDKGARHADVILTSGGASAGDEDHVSHLLRTRGTLSSWRIAMKPGRPLALALWQGVPVIGLPGNPVAALVCALIFGRPALSKLAGGAWTEPQGITVPAAFCKRKKAGRREYLRARLDQNGHAEVFASEGSGRISGLSWATGLVELPDEAIEVAPGTPVRFLPYSGFGV